MNKTYEIQLSQIQLFTLLNNEQQQGYTFLLEKGVYCKQCGGIASKGVEVEEVFLTNLNDVKVCGKCKACNGEVTRIMEFGEDRAFYEKANDFRKAIKN